VSEMMAMTGRERAGTCGKCGAATVQREAAGVTGRMLIWRTMQHYAPCGLPCFGGGAVGREGRKAYRAGAMHGLRNRPCPRCGTEGGVE